MIRLVNWICVAFLGFVLFLLAAGEEGMRSMPSSAIILGIVGCMVMFWRVSSWGRY